MNVKQVDEMKRALQNRTALLRQTLWIALRHPRPMITMLRVSLALTISIGLTINFSTILGRNVFLTGTVAIYLFPVKTWGGQIKFTVIGLLGALLGIAYADASLSIASRIQPGEPGLSRRIWLYCALLLAAFLAGYTRSKLIDSYVGITFFMIVNIFSLILGIDTYGPVFYSFIATILLGAAISLVLSFVWPEDVSNVIKNDAVNALHSAGLLIHSIRQSMFLRASSIQCGPLQADVRKLRGTLRDSKYELSFARVDSNKVKLIRKYLARIERLGNVIESATIGKHGDFQQNPWVLQGEKEDVWQEHFDTALQHSTIVLEQTSAYVSALYSGEEVSPIEVDGLSDEMERSIEAFRDQRHHFLEEDFTLENVSLVEYVNLMLIELLYTVQLLAASTNDIAQGRKMFWWPRGLRKSDEDWEDKEISSGASTMSTETVLLWNHDIHWKDRILLKISHGIRKMRRSRHLKYAIKFTIVLGALGIFAFINDWRIWFRSFSGQFAMISAMVVMEVTHGMTIRTAIMKIIGATSGGLLAYTVFQASAETKLLVHNWRVIGLTFVVGLLPGHFVRNKQTLKAGTVFALAYNVILGMAILFPEDGGIHKALLRRLASLPVGLFVAMVVQFVFFPARARVEIHKAVSHGLDSIHHLIFAIVAAEEYPALPSRFKELIDANNKALAYADSLQPCTKYEVSLIGDFPSQRFTNIQNKLRLILYLVIGGSKDEPILSLFSPTILYPGFNVQRCQLLSAICNDIIVLAHAIRVKVLIPGQKAYASSASAEYSKFVHQHLDQIEVAENAYEYFQDLGRLRNLVEAIESLRSEIDELIAETRNPTTSLMPHRSRMVLNSGALQSFSRPSSRHCSRRSTLIGSPALSRNPSRRNSMRGSSPEKGRARDITFALGEDDIV